MSQHLIHCPKCETKHLVDVLRMAGQPTALVSQCGYENTNSSVINSLIAGHKNLSKINWQPIATAPTDGTVIMGYWQDDPDPRPQEAFYSQTTDSWVLCPGGIVAGCCVAPSHWTSLNSQP